MMLKTNCHGNVEYNEKDLITFKKGLPGFNELRKFILFPVQENEMFSILHSVEDENTGFVVTSPFNVIEAYEFELSDEKSVELAVQSPEDVIVVNTVTLNSDPSKITVNMRAPIVINIKEHLGEQIILNDSQYEIKHPLFEGGAECL